MMRANATSALLILAALALATEVGAFGEMDGVWFKTRFQGKGFDLEPTGLGGKTSVKGTCYVHLMYANPDPNDPGSYDTRVVCETAPGSWETVSGFVTAESPDLGLIAEDRNLAFTTAAGLRALGYGVFVVRPKLDKSGALKSASFESLGAEMLSGSRLSDPNTPALGGYRVKGKTVPLEKLPSGVEDAIDPNSPPPEP